MWELWRELAWGYARRVCYTVAPHLRPNHFSRSWEYSTFRLDRVPAELGDRAGAAPDFIFLPMNDWHTRLQRTHHFALALAAAGHRCFYFSPQLGYEYRKPYLLDPFDRIGVLGPRLFEVHVRLPREHAADRRLLLPSESDRVANAITALHEQFRIQSAVLLMSLPVWLDAARTCRERHGFPIVYDCHDYLAGFGGIAREVVDLEREVFGACDLALFSAENLLASAVASHERLLDRSLLLRNAADPGHFGAQTGGSARPERTRKIAGYFGALEHWFDVEAVAAAAEAHPEVEFVLIGAVQDPAIEELRRYPNVNLAGEAPYAELPQQLSRFDAALIPFRLTPLTLATNPLKLYEYMAAGVPVVSTKLPEVERCGDLVYVAGSPAEFASRVGQALAEDDPELQARRREFARSESWQARTRALLERLSPLLAERARA